ncbi:MAG TPA: hypothetical protein VG820_03555 [Fimbriimonadaceae bacterium]|nr:hypothetical protein [Fimbriimonadaceae bacterium]
MGENRWSLDLEDDLAMLRPDGSPVQFETRKARAIVAMAALCKGQPLRRTEIAAVLWPVVAKDAAALNLRKDLQRVRKAQGHDGPLLIGRETVRLNTDVVDILSWDPTLLLPEMTEPWFDAFRPRTAAAGARRERAAVEGFLSVLEWSSRYRPREGLEIARRMPELTEMSLPERVDPLLLACLTGMSPSDPPYRWGLALRGVAATVSGDLPAVVRLLTQAHDLGVQHTDEALLAFTTFYFASALMTAGRVAEAHALMSTTRGLRTDGDSAIRLRHGRGLALIHGGDFSQGFDEFREARQFFSPATAPYERAYLLANFAWFESTVGDPKVADEILNDLESLGFEDCVRIHLTSLLARSASLIRRGRPDEAEATLETALEIGVTHRLAGFQIYASEGLAACSLARGEKTAAQAHMTNARRVRRAHSYGVTEWDRQRLARLKAPLLGLS